MNLRDPGILLDRNERVGAHVVEFLAFKGYIATYPCGRYPTMSNRGMKYILVLYDYDSNIILAAPMKSIHKVPANRTQILDSTAIGKTPKPPH